MKVRFWTGLDSLRLLNCSSVTNIMVFVPVVLDLTLQGLSLPWIFPVDGKMCSSCFYDAEDNYENGLNTF